MGCLGRGGLCIPEDIGCGTCLALICCHVLAFVCLFCGSSVAVMCLLSGPYVALRWPCSSSSLVLLCLFCGFCVFLLWPFVALLWLGSGLACRWLFVGFRFAFVHISLDSWSILVSLFVGFSLPLAWHPFGYGLAFCLAVVVLILFGFVVRYWLASVCLTIGFGWLGEIKVQSKSIWLSNASQFKYASEKHQTDRNEHTQNIHPTFKFQIAGSSLAHPTHLILCPLY